MWESVIQQAAANGLWALLFVALLVFILRDSKAREEKYQDTVRRLSQSLNVVLEIRDDLKQLCVALNGLKCVRNKKSENDKTTAKNIGKVQNCDKSNANTATKFSDDKLNEKSGGADVVSNTTNVKKIHTVLEEEVQNGLEI